MSADNPSAVLTAPTGLSRERQKLFDEMPPATQELALDIDAKQCQSALGEVLIAYHIGGLIARATVARNEGIYGTEAVEQLAAYNGKSAATLYALRDWARCSDEAFVKEWTAKPMEDGRFLTTSHWLALRQVTDPKKVAQLLKKAVANCWSANELDREVRTEAGGSGKRTRHGGGRKSGQPTSLLAGLQRFGTLAQSLVNYDQQVMADKVFPSILTMEADQIDDTLLKRLQETQDYTAEAKAKLNSAAEKLERCIAHVRDLLDQKDEGAEKARQKLEEVDEPTSGSEEDYDEDEAP